MSDCTAFLLWRQYKCTTEGSSWTKCYFGDKKEHRLTASHFSESQAVIFPPTDTRSPYRKEVILSSWRASLFCHRFSFICLFPNLSALYCSLSRKCSWSQCEVYCCSLKYVFFSFTVFFFSSPTSALISFLWFLFYLLSLAFVKHVVFVCLLYINTSHLITNWK